MNQRIFVLPFVLAGYFFEAFGRATLEMERIAGETFERARREGLDPLFAAPTEPSISAAPPAARPSDERPSDGRIVLETSSTPRQTTDAPAARPRNLPEDRTMADTNLNDDMVKLVQYAIVSIKRREERILTDASNDGELGRPLLYLETDNITGDGFSNARIADWVRDHTEEAKHTDLESLRVYYDVVARWPRSSLKYEEERLDLEDEKIELLRKMAG